MNAEADGMSLTGHSSSHKLDTKFVQLDTKFAQLDRNTLKYLFPENSYAATCRAVGVGRRCKTPSLDKLFRYVTNTPRTDKREL